MEVNTLSRKVCITFARGKVTGIHDQGNDHLDEAVLEISTSYFHIIVPGFSLRGICEIGSVKLDLRTLKVHLSLHWNFSECCAGLSP